jgi:hypothetical protein
MFETISGNDGEFVGKRMETQLSVAEEIYNFIRDGTSTKVR